MSTSRRLGIRNALVTALEAALGIPVYRNLDYALQDGQLPAAVVESGGDSASPRINHQADRDAEFRVMYLVRSDGTAPDPEADADALEILGHRAITTDTTLQDLTTDLLYTGGTWEFDLGDLVSRGNTYSVRFVTPRNSLE